VSKETLFGYGFLISAVPISWVFGGPIGGIIAGVVGIGILIAAHKQKDKDEEEFEDSSLFGGSVPWADPKEPSRKPNLILSGSQYLDVQRDDTEVWREKWVPQTPPKGLLFVFRNDPYPDGKGVPALGLRAQILWEYDSGIPGPTCGPAPWLDEEYGIVDIPVGVTKKLWLAVRYSEYWSGFANPRTSEMQKPSFSSDLIPIRGTMQVRLMGEMELWFNAKFDWKIDERTSHPRFTLLSCPP